MGDQAKSRNELHDVDIALHTLLSSKTVDNNEKFRISLENLKALMSVMEGIENGLESLCKQLTETKASLIKTADCMAQMLIVLSYILIYVIIWYSVHPE